MRKMHVVLWWLQRNHRPTVVEAIEQLEQLRKYGPSPKAFTFRNAFLPPDAQQPYSPFAFEDECPAV